MLWSDAGLVHVGAVRPGGVARVRQGQRHGAQPKKEGQEELQGNSSGSSQPPDQYKGCTSLYAPYTPWIKRIEHRKRNRGRNGLHQLGQLLF